jgi:hypothetical protein
MSKTGALTEKAANAVTKAEPNFASDAGTGFEGAKADDYAIPFLQILQALSPQVKRSDGAYIEGAAEGMVHNTVTNRVIDVQKQPLVVIACAYKRAFVEWRLREKGGGFVAEHAVAPAPTERDDRSRDILPNGNQLNDTRTFYVLVLDPDTGTAAPAVLSMTSTQIRKAKAWLMQQNLLKLSANGKPYTPPMFASKWAVTTVPEQNEKGSWYGWKFEHAGYLDGPDDPRFVEAREFYRSVSQGVVKADMSKSSPDENGAAGQRVDPETGEVMQGGEHEEAF